MNVLIYRLDETQFGKVREIFKDQKDHAVINAIIYRNNPGNIYVDNLDEPRTVLIWAKNEICFLAGAYDNEDFNNSLDKLISESLAPEAMEIDDTYFQVQAIPEDKWNPILEAKLAHRLPKKYYRWAFAFESDRYKTLESWRDKIPEGYSIRKIDKSILDIDRDNIVKKEVGKFWASFNDFLSKGVGFCALHGRRVVSTCISAFVSGNKFEISINTYSLKYRKKGLATILARVFIDYCIENNKLPCWGTETFRHPSIRIAEKCGFKKLNTYSFYSLGYDELDNLILSVDYYLTKNENIPLAEEMFKKLLEKGEPSELDFYILGSDWAKVGDKGKAFFCIEKAIEKGYRNIENISNNENLEILHNTEKWNAILKKLGSNVNTYSYL